MKKLSLIIAALLLSIMALSKEYTGGIKATVINREGRIPIKGALVQLFLNGEKLSDCTTDSEGAFIFENLENANYTLEVSAPSFITARINAAVEKGFVRDLIFVSLTSTSPRQDVDDSNFNEFDLQDSGYSDNPIILFGTNDPFNSIASFGFSSIRYKNRGYNSETQDVLLSGVELNDAITGFSPYSLWSGLNEATREKETTTGVESSDYALGRFNGTTNILGTPVSMRPGWRFSALTNSALYRLRLMTSYATGQLDNGWAFAFNASARVGGNDWVEGVYYRSFAFYAGAQKNWDDIHNLSLFVLAAPGERGAQNASTQEVYDLMGDNMYNSNWGYQNGKVRNSRVRRTFEPVTVLKYKFTPDNDDFSLDAALLWRTGKNGYTALDWYDANDPRPDYYRNLPSYYSMDDEDYDRNSEVLALWAKESWNPEISAYSRYQHLDWDRLYDVNRNNAEGRSKYALEERRVDQNDLHAVVNAKYAFNNCFSVRGGLHGRLNRTENYKMMNDLLGGQYYLNVDSFAERDFAASTARLQNDLDYYVENGEAERILKGGKYGYDYLAQIRNLTAWANGIFTLGSFKASLGGSLGYDAFWRDGLMRKGLFAGTQEEVALFNEQLSRRGLTPDLKYNGQTSKGKSDVSRFLEYSGKANLEYSFAGGHRAYANVGYFNEAPTFAASFISPRTRNTLIDNLTTKKTFSADLNYQYSSSFLDVRATGYYTTIKDGTDVMSFYDDAQKSFTNFAMTGIDERHAGIELGFRIALPVPSLSLEGALAWGEHIYTSTPHMKQTIDNSAEMVGEADVTYWKHHPVYKRVRIDGQVVIDKDVNENPIVDHWEKHYVPSSPQLASQLALKYNYDYWFFEVNGQYFANSYLDMNPLYRIDGAVAGPDGVITPIEVEYMCSQENLYDGAGKFLLNASIGKSWYIRRTYNLGFSLNVSNILNDRNFKTGGYEQTRLVTSSQKDRYLRFDSRYFYMQGINYMLNLYFRF